MWWDMAFYKVPLTQLIDLAEGRLSDEERAQVLDQIGDDPSILSEVTSFAKMIALMRTDTSTDPPPDVVARALRLYRMYHPPTESSVRRHLKAMLQFDWRQPVVIASLRASRTTMQQLLFVADEYAIDVRLTASGVFWGVAGQVLGAKAGGVVELRGPNTMQRAMFDEHCKFVMQPVTSGRYSLFVQTDTADIDIDELQIG
jgi:anti-sigma factor RsiW